MDNFSFIFGVFLWTVVCGEPLAVPNPSTSGTGRQSLQLRGPGNPLPVASDTSTSVPKVGVDRDIAYQCTFFHNSSYTCKTDCDSSRDIESKPFPNAPHLKYIDRNCSTDVPVSGATWKNSYGFIRRRVDPSRPNDIIATCTFYQTAWFECYGIADCSRGTGILTCAGAAPWRGRYEGSPEKGTIRGTITAEAQHSPPMQPPPKPAVQAPVGRPDSSAGTEGTAPRPNVLLSAPKKIVVACEKFVDSSAMCYGFDKTCSGPPEQQTCSHSRNYIPRTSTSEAYYGRFDSVVLAVQEDSLVMASDIVVECYFYDNNEYLCGFPFAASLKPDQSLSLQLTRGRYYRSRRTV